MKFSMKRTLFMKTLLFSAATVALCGMTACSGSDDNIIGEQTAQDGKVYYRISIPATIGDDAQTRAVTFDANGTDITTTFKTTDKIYAYNKTQNYFYVQNFSPDADAKSANLINGSANWLDDSDTRWVLNDEIVLMYNLSQPGGGTNSYFQYDGNATIGQLGTAATASAHDFAVATITVTGKTGTGTEGDPFVIETSPATFENLGSMFRQRFTFADADDNAIATPTVTKLVITDANNKITNVYYPLKAAAEQDHITNGIYLKSPDMSTDVYWAMRFAGEAGKITFLAYTSDNQIYEGSKNAPAAGFANGKYYHSNTPVTMKPSTSVIQPTATGNYEYNTSYNYYRVTGDATFSGNSTGVRFRIWNSGHTLTLDNASFYTTGANEYPLIYCNGTVTINLQGDNAITYLGPSLSSAMAFDKQNTTLSITGNGTLTLTCRGKRNANCPGFYTNSGDVVQAADGHTLTHTETQNADGTWTFVYTVTPNN